MDVMARDQFIELWRRHFNGSELPITFYYSDDAGRAELARPSSVPRCVIGALAEVRKGHSLSFDANSIGCFGGRRYLGFADRLRPDFEYFLSCGIPGKVEGERYKKSPELVRQIMKTWPAFKAPRRFAVFKRWDDLDKADEPDVVVFFAQPDVMAGLFTLVNFDEPGPEGVFAPMGSGCSSIVSYPYMEKDSAHPRAVIGMFDPSARPHVPRDVLTFSVPMTRFVPMIANMEQSFLTTGTWKTLQERITAAFSARS